MHPLTPRLVVLTLFLASAACGILPEGDPAGTQAVDSNTQTTPTGGGGGGGGAVTYDNKIGAIFTAKCGNCHGQGGSFLTNFDGSTKDKVVAGAQAIAGAVAGGSMPLSGSPALTADEKQAFADWITSGGK